MKKSKNNKYIDTPKPENPYNGSTEEIDILTSERGTIRVPMIQKLEFDALLATSELSYSYELMAELVYEATKRKSKEENDKYKETLADLKRKEKARLEKKKQNKAK